MALPYAVPRPWIARVNAVREPPVAMREPSDMRPVKDRIFVFFAAQQDGRQRGRKRERVEQRNGNRKCDRQRKLLVKNSRSAREKRYRHEHRNQHQRCRHHRARHFLHGRGCRRMRIGVVLVDVPLDIFDHHDRVVDHQSGRQGDAEKRERIDREPKHLDEGKSADQRNRNGDRRNNRGAPVQQEQEDHHDDDERPLLPAWSRLP